MTCDYQTLKTLVSENKPSLLYGGKTHITENILSYLPSYLDKNGHLTETSLKKFLRDSHDPGLSKQRHERHLATVLHTLNETGSIRAVLPPQRVTVPRPAVLPPSVQRAAKLHAVHQTDIFLDDWLKNADGFNHALLALAIRLVTRMGFAENLVVTYLARTNLATIKRATPVNVPIAPTARASDVYPLRPPTAVADMQAKLGARARRHGDILHVADQTHDVEAQCRAVREHLEESYARLCHDQASAGIGADPPLQRWTTLAHVGRYRPRRKSVPPALIDLLRAFPLPAASDSWWINGPARPRRLPASKPATTPAGPHHDDAGHPLVFGTLPEVPSDWFRFATTIRRTFLRSMERLYENSTTAKNSRIDEAQNILQRSLEATDHHIGTHTSVVHLALEWALHLRSNENLRLSSIDTYLSRLLNRTLLSSDESQDICEWDSETISELLTDITTQERWGRTTQQQFHNTFRRFLKFIQYHGFIEDVPIPESDTTLLHTAHRTTLLSPHEVDDLAAWLTDATTPRRDLRILALALYLGFYGGLRASEVANLALGDIVAGDEACFVYVRNGKTHAARRKIPLHVMAPRAVREALAAWCDDRAAELAGQRAEPARVALFGPRATTNAYARHAVIDPVIQLLRSAFGPDVDFHTLRHNAVSWMLVRIHAARYPDFRDRLAVQHHATFASDHLDTLRQTLCGFDGEDGERRGVHLLQLAKIVGHRDVGTMLVHYGHTLHEIHSDILERAWHRGASQL